MCLLYPCNLRVSILHTFANSRFLVVLAQCSHSHEYVYCMYCMLYVLYAVCIVCCMYCMLYVLYTVCIVYCMYCMLYVLYAVCIVCCMYCMLYVLYAVCICITVNQQRLTCHICHPNSADPIH